MEYVTLNTGVQMPMEGFGVFQVTDYEVCRRSVLDAIKHFDPEFVRGVLKVKVYD